MQDFTHSYLLAKQAEAASRGRKQPGDKHRQITLNPHRDQEVLGGSSGECRIFSPPFPGGGVS